MNRTFAQLFLLLAVVVASWPVVALAEATDVERVLTAPGVDFSKLPAAAKKELAGVFLDEFDYCGRPLTIAASLKKDPCKHTRRMAAFAGMMAGEGMTAGEIITALAKYNQTFTAKRAEFKADERTCKGPSDAKITLTEFSDFECPYCNAARPTLEALLKKRKDTRLCYQPFPLPAHPNAIPASQAALFARDAGKFWAMHDLLFDNQTALSPDLIKKLAAKLGLDVAGLTKAMADGKYQDELTASKDLGRAAGVDSTPMLYFNGRRLSLNPTPEALTLAIEDETEWAAGKSTWPSN